MKQVSILEDDDTIHPDDWCRPLDITSMSGGMSDHYSFKSCYTGSPENNTEWTKVKCVIGECWFGKTVKQFSRVGLRYEFIRGDVPKSHKLNMADYTDLSKGRKKVVHDDYNDDIPF